MTGETFAWKLRNCNHCLKTRLAIGLGLFVLGAFILAATWITWEGTINAE